MLNSRHRALLENAAQFLDAFLGSRDAFTDYEQGGHNSTCAKLPEDGWLPPEKDLACITEELRYAAQAIGRITGRIDVEDVLDVIFKEFCIGK